MQSVKKIPVILMVHLKPKRCLRQHWFQVAFAYVSQHHNADNSRPYIVAGINMLGKFMLLGLLSFGNSSTNDPLYYVGPAKHSKVTT